MRQRHEKLIADRPDVTIAVYTSPKQSVIAGPPDQVDELVATVDAQGKLARRIEVDVASHHPTIDPVLPELREALSYLAPAAPKIPLISTVAYAGSSPLFSADYWAANLRNPVRFSQAVHDASAEHSNFIEISPHPLLAHAITDTLAAQSDQPQVPRGRDGEPRPPGVAGVPCAAGRGAAARGQGARRTRRAGWSTRRRTAWQHTTFWMADRSAGRRASRVRTRCSACMSSCRRAPATCGSPTWA